MSSETVNEAAGGGSESYSRTLQQDRRLLMDVLARSQSSEGDGGTHWF